jgi:flavin-dependent dehydrogenase
VVNKRLGAGSFEDSTIVLSVPVDSSARYVKFDLRRGEKASRILLGEIVIGDGAVDDAAKPKHPFMARPMHVKRTLDNALMDAGVEFLFGCYVTNILRDDEGEVAGIVMTNRSGRQAVRAKTVIDATPRGVVARMAGATFVKYPSGPQSFWRVVVGDAISNKPSVESRKISAAIQARRGSGRKFEAVDNKLTIDMADGSFASFARAEQIGRDMTFDASQADSSEVLFQVPPDPMRGVKSSTGAWVGASEIDLDVFRPAGVDRVYVLGGCADVSRDAAEKLLRPVELIEAGSRIGKAAARESLAVEDAKGVKPAAITGTASVSGDVGEVLEDIYPRRAGIESVEYEEHSLPVIDEYDVVVVGGGTGGAPAGIGAGRQGAKVLVIEYLHGLGGVGTLGLISKYYHGNRVGFTAEVDEGMRQLKEDAISSGRGWNVEVKMEWYRRELRKAGVEIWFGTLGAAAFVEDGRVKGVVVATPEGRGVVLAKVVIDSTGNAGIAASAGAECTVTDDTHIAVQGTGLPPRELGASYTNTDYTFVDDSDVTDMWRSFVIGREKFKDAYDMGQLIDTRERRQIVGDYFLTPLDIYKRRTFPDTIVVSMSNFDSHGYTVHPTFLIRPPDRKGMVANVPYRCLLPKGLDGILVTGLGVSGHRDAMPVIRMQPDIQNQGYGAGVAAAMIAKKNISTREVDFKAVQRHLVEKGNLPESVLTDKDSFPLPKSEIVEAVKTVVNNYEGLESILTQPQTAIPLMREAYRNADPNEAIVYAHVLGMLGDATGVEALIATIGSSAWDKGWNYTGMGQFGMSISHLDSLIIALGRTGDAAGLGVILEKVRQLDTDKSEFSHYRAVAVALETLGDSIGAKPLAELLRREGVMGHSYTDIEEVKSRLPGSSTDNTTRNLSLRELVLARALYKCGDYERLGEKVLKRYGDDYRGHYSRHAHAILNAKVN